MALNTESQRGRAKVLPDTHEQFEIISLEGMVLTDTVCKAFGKTFMTIFNWRTQKGMPFVKVGSGELPKILFRPAHVAAWADELGIPYDAEVLLADTQPDVVNEVVAPSKRRAIKRS